MDEIITSCGVYIKLDEDNRIDAVNSSAFLQDTNGWLLIDSGDGDKYHHAQGRYFERDLYNEDGTHNYQWDGTQARLCTDEERSQELATFPEPDPSIDQQQWQAITDLEIEQIEQAQQLTDLEIEVLTNEQ